MGPISGCAIFPRCVQTFHIYQCPAEAHRLISLFLRQPYNRDGVYCHHASIICHANHNSSGE